MLLKKAVAVLSLAGLLAIPMSAGADTPISGCVMSSYHPTAVQPLHRVKRWGRTETNRLVGARVFIPAQLGLTPQWIQRNINWHVAAMKGRPMAGCPLAVSGASASVVSADTGFWVEIATDDSNLAQQILARARGLVH